jgi:hypothetical protein
VTRRLPLALTLAFAALLALDVPAARSEEADGPFVDHLVRQLACTAAPDPTPILLYLNKHKRIDLDHGDRIDSETCWAIKPPLAVRGMEFTHICAGHEDALFIELFPRLYYRGPGTSAGTGFELVTKVPQADLLAWVKANVATDHDASGDAKSKLKIGKPSFVDSGVTELGCNSMSFWGKNSSLGQQPYSTTAAATSRPRSAFSGISASAAKPASIIAAQARNIIANGVADAACPPAFMASPPSGRP